MVSGFLSFGFGIYFGFGSIWIWDLTSYIIDILTLYSYLLVVLK